MYCTVVIVNNAYGTVLLFDVAAVLPMLTPRLAGAGGTTARFLLRGRRWPFFFSAARSHEACFSSGRVACRLHQAGGRVLVVVTADRGVIISRVVSMLDSGAEGPGFKSQSRRCWVIVLGKLFTPIVPLFTKQQNR